MIRDLYKQQNNIFQSEVWLDFQKEAGREILDANGTFAIVSDIKFGKQFAWTQKIAPKLPITNKDLVFLRVEPESENQIKKYKLKKVTGHSLLAGQKSPKATRVLDLSLSEEDILAQMKPKTRYNIRLAEKKGVSVKISDSADVLYDLLQKTASRDKGYVPHEKSYYEKMIKILSNKNLGHLFLAEHDGDPLAAIFVTIYGELAIYLHGGFNDSKRNLMAPYLCQWEAIKYAKKQRCKYYDFWGVAESDDPNDPWAGISRFKEGFGGEKVFFPGTYDYVLSPSWYNLLTFLAKVNHIIRR